MAISKYHREFAELVLSRSRQLARSIKKLRYSDFRLLLREVRKTELA